MVLEINSQSIIAKCGEAIDILKTLVKCNTNLDNEYDAAHEYDVINILEDIIVEEAGIPKELEEYNSDLFRQCIYEEIEKASEE
jgi:hypothetical protein